VERSILQSWGYDSYFSTAFSTALSALASPASPASPARPDLAPARVLSDLGVRVEIVEPSGQVRFAQLSGRLRHLLRPHERPTAGDWVVVAADTGLGEPDLGAGAPSAAPGDIAIIHAVLPRRTQLVRRAAGRGDKHQLVAANVDTFFVVTSANRDANVRRVERYLATVWDSGAAPVIVVNKVDLCAPGELHAQLAELSAIAPSVQIVSVSAHNGAGLGEIAAYLRPGRTVALIGSSGVGKSSLVNRLLDDDRQAVLPIDAVDRGRHATTRRQLFALPSGGLVIDTPGMRELGLAERGHGLDDAFADIAELAGACRFRNCQHRGEPGCAVDTAIASGGLDPDRLDSPHKLERELEAIERRRDPALAREERTRMRAVNKAQRARTKVDPKHHR